MPITTLSLRRKYAELDRATTHTAHHASRGLDRAALNDPAFPPAFPTFDSVNYWSKHVLELREQLALLDEPPLTYL